MVQISAAGTSESAGSIRVAKRSYFSTHHLYAACYAAEDAQKRETELTQEHSLFDVRHRGLVMVAITEAAFFLEAAINEIFQDAADGHASYISGLEESTAPLLAAVWDATKKGFMEPLTKYDLALRLAGREPFDQGRLPYQSALALVQLRNYLVHYKPETIEADAIHRFEKTLNRGLFKTNALMDASNSWFPERALGAGCAGWAWRSARALTDEFAKRMGITMNYQLVSAHDPLPK